ncbi:MAG TPA: helix-turn-helix transcriptional regulator [Solirubrobacterales bacterium]|jgi:transcriptional regulator with XRE-family HTH domain
MSAERDAKHFGRNLLLARRRHGLSQERLAARAGLSRDTIYKIEMGTRSPRLDTLLRLADTLGVDPCELLMGLRP